jgi:predicted transcriptional regulator YdeE
MAVEIIQRPKAALIGLLLKDLTPADAGRIGPLWERFLPRMMEVDTADPERAYGVNLARSQERFDYLAGVAVGPQAKVPKGMTRIEIPGGRYARFVHRGPVGTLMATIEKAFGEWLPAARLEHGPGPLLEVYGPRFKGPQNPASEFDYLVPVK